MFYDVITVPTLSSNRIELVDSYFFKLIKLAENFNLFYEDRIRGLIDLIFVISFNREK
jgi:hypothetical protein